MTDNKEKNETINCGDCNYYMSGKCALFGKSREAYDGCKHGETGGVHPDIAKYYRNRGY